LRAEDGQQVRAREVAQEAAQKPFPEVSGISSRWDMIFVASKILSNTTVAVLQFVQAQAKEGQHGFDRQEPSQAKRTILEAKLAVDERIAFKEELKCYVAIPRKSTYCGLLGIAGDCDRAESSKAFTCWRENFTQTAI